LFGVTTDYLLKDEIDAEEFAEEVSDAELKRVSIEEANAFLAWRKRAALRIASATCLCIFSVIVFLLFGGLSDTGQEQPSDYIPGIIGLVFMIVMVAIAVAIFIFCGFQNEPYDYLDKDISFELAYGVKGMLKERQKAYRGLYVRNNIIATVICVLSPIPLLVGAFTESESFTVMMLGVMLGAIGVAVFLFILSGVRWASMQKLLKEGEYAPKEKRKSTIKEVVGFAYWGILTGVYLFWSFLSNAWGLTWIVFALGGILFPVALVLTDAISDQKKQE